MLNNGDLGLYYYYFYVGYSIIINNFIIFNVYCVYIKEHTTT